MHRPVDTFFYRCLFTGIAVAGVFAEWVLACWLFPALVRWPLAAHVAVLGTLVALNRVAARALRHDPPPAPIFAVPARVTTAAAYCALAGATVLFALLALALTVDVVAEPSAEAGVIAAHVPLRWPAEVPLAFPLVALAIGLCAYGYARGHRRLVVVEHEVRIAGLPPGLDGLRLVHLSDVHVGPMADMECVRAAIDRVLALDPDVVCITGDIVDSPATNFARWMPELARLRARHGVFAILGNHDRIAGADRVAEAVRAGTSWRLLRDEAATVEIDGGRLHLLGLEDRWGRETGEPLTKLLAAVPAGEAAVLLAHRPSAFAPARAAGIGLTLAGHTHGGQLAVPGVPRLNVARIVMTRFDRGIFTAGRSTLHVSRGLGVTVQPVRIGVPREIAVLRLVAPANVDRVAGGC